MPRFIFHRAPLHLPASGAEGKAEVTGPSPDIGAPVHGVGDLLTVHAETFERPVSDQKAAAQAAISTVPSWPITAILHER